MPTITNIDRTSAGTIRQLLNEALARVAEQHGLKITVGSGRFTDTDVSFEVNAAVIVDGVAQTPTRKLWQSSATSLGLKPEWIDRSVTYNGKKYRIDGLRGGAPKYNVRATDLATGQVVFLNSAVIVKNALRGCEPSSN